MAQRALAVFLGLATVALGSRVGSLDEAAAAPVGKARSGKGGASAAPPSATPPVLATSRSGKGGRAEPAVEPVTTSEERATAIEEIREKMRAELKKAERSLMPEIEAAAARVVKLKEFQEAKVVRVHLNARTYQVRLAALKAGKKLLYVQPDFYNLVLVDPAKLQPKQYAAAATPSGMKKLGETLDVDARIKVDLFVIASMAVDPRTGCRVGPPGSSEELEYGMLRQMRAVGKRTPVVTMADSHNLLRGLSLSSESLCARVSADIICSPKRTFVVKEPSPRLGGIDFEKIGRARLGGAPLLRRLRKRAAGKPPATKKRPAKAPAPAAAARSGKGGRTAA